MGTKVSSVLKHKGHDVVTVGLEQTLTLRVVAEPVKRDEGIHAYECFAALQLEPRRPVARSREIEH